MKSGLQRRITATKKNMRDRKAELWRMTTSLKGNISAVILNTDFFWKKGML